MMTYPPTAIAPAAFRWLARREVPNKMMNIDALGSAFAELHSAAGILPAHAARTASSAE
jgi:hypothetical protein